MPKKPTGSPTFKTSLAKTSKSDSSAKMPTPKPAAKPKKVLSFDDPDYGKPAPFDAAYHANTLKIAKQQRAYEAGAVARANAKAAKMSVGKKTPAKGGPGYIGIGGKKS